MSEISKHLRKCEKRERDRERFKRKAAKRQHLAAMISLDALPPDAEKFNSWLSDNGEGARRIIDACDGILEESYFDRLIASARRKVKSLMPECLEVFDLIIENGSNRKESIWMLMLKKRPNGRRQKCFIGDN